ncbi:MAG: hypothetical protein Q7R76_06035 [Candidatus Woesearchaeota archaeon]|nr:hypothetical protein [Candidatus Woesearchaeota archaeon]
MDLRLRIYLDIIRVPLLLIIFYNALSVPVMVYERLAFLQLFFTSYVQWAVLVFIAAWAGLLSVKKCKEAALSFIGPTKTSIVAGAWLGFLGGMIGGFLGALMTVDKGVTITAMLDLIRNFVVPGTIVSSVVACISSSWYRWNTRFD